MGLILGVFLSWVAGYATYFGEKEAHRPKRERKPKEA